MAAPTVVELDAIQAGSQVIWFAATTLFVVYWSMNKRWWKSIWAKMFISLDIALWFVDLPNCLHQWFHFSLQNTFFAYYDILTVWGVALTIFWRAGMIVYIQLTRERREAEWEEEDGEIPGSNLQGSGAESGVGRYEESSTLRASHPGGDGGGN
jgi:hypothetical protein